MLSYADSIKEAIFKYGVVKEGGKDIFAYEVDGSGSYRIYDDSNLPSILSMAYLGFIDVKDQTKTLENLYFPSVINFSTREGRSAGWAAHTQALATSGRWPS